MNATSLLTAVMLALAVNAPAGVSTALPIRNRTQWLENSGYCGETSLQECALYHGMYVSQAYIRAIFDPSQQNDLVEVEEWQQVLAILGFKAEFFDNVSPQVPQYQSFAVWAKQQLARRHPVITTCYIRGGPAENPVDHIITLTGFTAEGTRTYSDRDTFTLTHHLAGTTEGIPGAPFSFSQRGKWLFDNRTMTDGGAIYGYAIQKETNYALAITGTTNTSRDDLPVRVELEKITEANLIAGEAPEQLAAEIEVQNLKPGRDYVLYRYNDPARVPAKNHASQPAASKVAFKASARTQVFDDTILSDGIAIYRCLPTGR